VIRLAIVDDRRRYSLFRSSYDEIENIPKGTVSKFRSGSLKSIDLWAVSQADLAGGNPNRWVLLGSVKLLVNGLIYYDCPLASNQFWSIVDRKTAATAAYNYVDASGSSIVSANGNMYWLNIPFAQHTECLAGDNVVSTGIPIMNSVVNLEVAFPASTTYVLNASYNYASNLMFSRGKSSATVLVE
jgi:hypothetical protein